MNRLDDKGWETPLIRNYFDFLEFMLHETGEAELWETQLIRN